MDKNYRTMCYGMITLKIDRAIYKGSVKYLFFGTEDDFIRVELQFFCFIGYRKWISKIRHIKLRITSDFQSQECSEILRVKDQWTFASKVNGRGCCTRLRWDRATAEITNPSGLGIMIWRLDTRAKRGFAPFVRFRYYGNYANNLFMKFHRARSPDPRIIETIQF